MRNADAIQHYRAGARRARAQCDAVESGAARGLGAHGRLSRPDRTAGTALGEYDIVEAGYRAAGDAPAQARILRKMGGLHWDAGDRWRGRSSASRPGSPCSATIASTSSRRTPTRRWAGWPSAAATASGPSSGRSRPGSRRAARRRPRARRGRARGSGDRRRAEPQHARRRLCPPEPAGGGGRAHRAQRGPRPGERAPAGRLPRAREPGACSTARLDPRAGDRDLHGRPRDGQEDRRPRVPVAPLRESRGGLLRAHQPLRRAGRRRRACRDRSRSAPRAARSSGGAADRARADLPVSRRSDPRDRALPGSARARRGGRRAAAAVPCYDGLATAHLDLGDEGQAEEFMQKAQAVVRARRARARRARVVLPFLD